MNIVCGLRESAIVASLGQQARKEKKAGPDSTGATNQRSERMIWAANFDCLRSTLQLSQRPNQPTGEEDSGILR